MAAIVPVGHPDFDSTLYPRPFSSLGGIFNTGDISAYGGGRHPITRARGSLSARSRESGEVWGSGRTAERQLPRMIGNAYVRSQTTCVLYTTVRVGSQEFTESPG